MQRGAQSVLAVAMAAALPDAAHVVLRRGTSRAGLYHRGTGELLPLQLSAAGVELGRTAAGWSTCKVDGADKFTFELLQFSYHKGGDDAGEPWYYRCERATRKSDRQSRYGAYNTASKTFANKVDLFEYSCEVFMSVLPRGLSCVRFELPRAMDLVIGPQRDGKWQGRHTKQLKALIDSVGVHSADHFSLLLGR